MADDGCHTHMFVLGSAGQVTASAVLLDPGHRNSGDGCGAEAVAVTNALASSTGCSDAILLDLVGSF